MAGKPKPKLILRVCLGPECKTKFKTDSRFQRLCHQCRRKQMYKYLDPK